LDPALQRIVLERLDSEGGESAAPRKRGRPKGAKPEGWDYLVLAALEGRESLAVALDAPPAAAERALPPLPESRRVPGIFLRQVRVQGFRGVGREARLDLNPGPGLTLVVGRNGSGKSSFAEALELLLTGDTFRWKDRSAVWSEAWRNLHEPVARIAADFAVEGEAAGLTVTREFAEGGSLEAGATSVERRGQSPAPFESLGWSPALSAWRPFLSYAELGSTFDRPTELHDRLAQILGLEDLAAAQKALAEERLARKKTLKQAGQERDALLAELAAHLDLRATGARALLASEEWGLDALAESLAADAATESGGNLAGLRQLAAVRGPAPEAVRSTLDALHAAGRGLAAAAGSLAERSGQLAELLEAALRFHDAAGDGPCPVCGREGALDGGWHQARAAEVVELRTAALAVTQARQQGERAVLAAASLLAGLPVQALAEAGGHGLEVAPLLAALEAWQRPLAALEAWRRQPEGAGVPGAALLDGAAALEAAAAPLAAALEALTASAGQELRRREDAWRPLALRLLAWIPLAQRARAAAAPLAAIEAAEGWLVEQGKHLRRERFAPIAQRARAIWERLRLQSNVELRDIVLEGAANQRRVELSVAVDGADSVALGVMSQGEIHALALSLFLPRATQPESPFRFLVIDDPVQSMDPARVDGLARVLAETARERQVVVFTHDDRLAESVRRLALDASIFAVTRAEGSVVEVKPNADPVERAIGDARALALTDELPPAAARRVVPGLCRQAIEAACMQAVRARRIGRGDRHDDVQAALEKSSGLRLVALALFDDEQRAGEVMGRLNRERRSYGDAWQWCATGSHEEVAGDLVANVKEAHALARWIARSA
jgi:recombinational DNA repair ATPase RecF